MIFLSNETFVQKKSVEHLVSVLLEKMFFNMEKEN